MKSPFPLEHVGDGELLSNNEAIWRRRRHCTAEGLAHLAEIDERKLYLPSACDTMQSFCIHELRFTPDEAEKRVTAARVARRFPVIFTMIAEGLHLTAVLILSPRLTPENAEELLAAAADKSLREIRLLLAQRFPRPDLPTQEPPSGDQLDLAASESPAPERVLETIPDEIAHGCADTPVARTKLMPLSPGRFGVQFTMSESARDHYEYARALLSHQLPQADLATVTEMALAALVEKLEKRKFGATRRPRSGARSAIDPRGIPAATRRQVFERDGGRCTFTSEAGKRCPATRFLETMWPSSRARALRRWPTCASAAGRTTSMPPSWPSEGASWNTSGEWRRNGRPRRERGHVAHPLRSGWIRAPLAKPPLEIGAPRRSSPVPGWP